jgi:AcrR family transcriptional regulator
MATATASARGVSKKARVRRDLRRERNRQSLIDATIALVLERGSGALSMVAVTKRAGVHHPVFYSNFKNIDECLEAAFKEVSSARHRQQATLRKTLWSGGRPDFATEVAVTEHTLNSVMQYRQLYLLILHCRHEQSRLGELAREEFDHVAEGITEYVWRVALLFGANAEHLREFEKVARYILEGLAAAALDSLHGRVKDMHALAERLTRYHWALVGAERERLGLKRALRPAGKRHPAG